MTSTKFGALFAAIAVMLGACSSGTATTPTGSGGTAFSFTPCPGSSNQTLLVAMQDGSGPWTAVTASGGTYSATFHSARVGVAEVTGGTGYADVEVFYALASEVQGFFTGNCTSPQLNATGSVNSLATGETASIGLGWNPISVSGPGTKSFSVPAASTTADLLAVLASGGSPAAKFILRRGTNANALTPIDFTTSEAFASATPSLSITGTGSSAVTFAEWYESAAGFRNQIMYGGASTTLPTTYWAIPAAQQLPGDLHELFAYTASTTNGGITSGSAVDFYGHDPVSRTLAFAALPSAPTVTSATTSPYPRLAAQWTMPASDTYVELYYYNGDQDVDLYATAGYLGGTAVNLEFPDLSAVPGWQPAWMPVAGMATNWGFYDYAFNMNRPAFAAPVDGFQWQYNYWRSALTP